MQNFSTSPIAALTGGGSNNPPPVNPGFIPGNDPLYIRDILSGMINQRISNFGSEEGKNALGALAYRVGRPMAIRLMTEAINFNTRPDMASASIDSRLQSFYSMGSKDPGVDNIIHRAANASSSVSEGYRSSPYATNAIGAAIAQLPNGATPATRAQFQSAIKKKTDVTMQ